MEQYKAPETSRRLAAVILAANIFGRPIVTPPGVSGKRVRLLRDAWNKAIKDPDFLAEAKSADGLSTLLLARNLNR